MANVHHLPLLFELKFPWNQKHFGHPSNFSPLFATYLLEYSIGSSIPASANPRNLNLQLSQIPQAF